MRKTVLAVSGLIVMASGIAFTQGVGPRVFKEALFGVKEVPVVSTTGSGTFRAEISRDEASIAYTLSFQDLEGDVRQAHIHIGPEQNTGGIVLWLCQTAANPSPVASTPHCFDPLNPATARSNTVSGVLTAADIIPQAANGIAAGEFEEVLGLIRAGKTYVNVHSAKFGPGEIRSQIQHGHSGQH